MADNTIKTQDNNNIFTGANGTGTDDNSTGLKIARAADVANLPYGAFSSANVAMVMNTVKALANNIYANFIPNKRILTDDSPILFYKNGNAQHPASGQAADDEQKSKFNYLVTGKVLKDNIEYHKPIINGSRDYNNTSNFIIPEMPANVNDVKNKIFGYGASAIGWFTAEVNTEDNFGITGSKIGIPINNTVKKITTDVPAGTDEAADFNISFIDGLTFSNGVLTKTKGQLTFDKKGILKSYQTGISDGTLTILDSGLVTAGAINSVKNVNGTLKYDIYNFNTYGLITGAGDANNTLLEPLTVVKNQNGTDPTAASLDFIYDSSGILKKKKITIANGKITEVTDSETQVFAPTYTTTGDNKNAEETNVIIDGSSFTKSKLTTNNQGFSKIVANGDITGKIEAGSFNAIVYTAAEGNNPATLKYKAISIGSDGRVTTIPASATSSIPVLFENAQTDSFYSVSVTDNTLSLHTIKYKNGQITEKGAGTATANVLSTANVITNLTVASTTIDTDGKITTSEVIEANGGIDLKSNNNNTGTITIS